MELDPRNWPAVSLAPLPGGGLFRGVQQRKTIPAPAVGTEWLFTTPGGQWTAILAGRFSLVTSAIAGNRLTEINLGDGSVPFFTSWPAATQAASLTRSFSLFCGGGALPTANAGTRLAIPLPQLLLPPGYSIGSLTTALDVGDQYSAIELLLAEIDMGPRGEPIGLVHLPPQLATVGV